MTALLTPLILALGTAGAPAAPQAASSIPAWVVSGDAQYPPQVFVVGVGSSRRSRESAIASAQGDVGRQIRARIRSSLEDKQISQRIGIGGASASASAQTISLDTRSESDLPLTGVQIVKTENAQGTWYALAALDKSIYSQDLEKRIDLLARSIRASLDLAAKAAQSAKPAQAVASLLQAERDYNQLQDFRALRISWSLTEVDSFSVSRADFDALYHSVVASLRITTVGGANQTTTTGKEWRAPLQVKVEAGQVPVSGFTLSAWDGKDNFLQKAVTGTDGIASIWLPPAGSAGRVVWTVKPRLDVPASLRPSLDALNQRMVGTVAPVPFPAMEWVFEGDSAQVLSSEARLQLARSGIQVRSGGKSKVIAHFAVSPSQQVQGLDKTLERMSLEVSLSLEGPGQNRQAPPLRASGFGKSPVDALRKALVDIPWGQGLDDLSQALTPTGKTRKIGVVILEAPQEGDEEAVVAAQLSSHLQSVLGQDTRIQLLERRKLDHLYQEVTAQLSGLFETSNDVLRQSGADAIILGEVNNGPDGLEVDVRMVDVATGQILSTASRSIDGTGLRTAAKELAKELVGHSLD